MYNYVTRVNVNYNIANYKVKNNDNNVLFLFFIFCFKNKKEIKEKKAYRIHHATHHETNVPSSIIHI